MNLTIDKFELPAAEKLAAEDKWILDRFNQLAASVTANLDKFEVGVALASLYDFVWDVFCDWYIELTKARLADKESESGLVAQNVLAFVLDGTLKLLHPFMPYITEEIYQALPHAAAGAPESIMISDFPKADAALEFPADAEHTERLISVIKAIRARRTEMNVPPSRKTKVYLETKYLTSFGEETYPFFLRLASASEVDVAESFGGAISADNAAQIVTDAATIYLPMNELIDTAKEKERLTKELAKIEGEIARLNGKLSNAGFVAKAPAAVVENERAKLSKYVETADGIRAALAKLG